MHSAQGPIFPIYPSQKYDFFGGGGIVSNLNKLTTFLNSSCSGPSLLEPIPEYILETSVTFVFFL